MEKVFGIDLGTTYSCIAYVDESGKPVIIKNSSSERITPSVVFLGDYPNIIVGNEAKNILKTDPAKVISFIKRSMGDQNFIFNHNNINFKPEEISSFILKKIVSDAEQEVDLKIKDVVITVPAYFGINEREATKKAGELIGLNVLSLINEPTAAALSYGLDKEDDQTVLIYDLGGGTFDVTIIKISSNNLLEVVVTDGDHNLGGKNWDDVIMTFLQDEFVKQTGIQDDLLSTESEIYGELQLYAEEIKKTLTNREKTQQAITYGTHREKIEITKETFNNITDHLAKKTILLTNRLLESAKQKGVNNFDSIILVGGSTRMPQIKAILELNYPNKPIKIFDQDEAVAKGAAIYGHQMFIKKIAEDKINEKFSNSSSDNDWTTLNNTQKKEILNEISEDTGLTLGGVEKALDIKISNVISKSFGIQSYQNEILKVVNLIFKQSKVPCEISETFGTRYYNQDSVKITVCENELSEVTVEIDQSKEIGEGTINGLPQNLPADSPIEVCFKINEQGLLTVKATEKTGNNEIIFTIETTSVINKKEFKEAKERSNSIKIS